ncbi:MAG: purine-binding chemotaxis protein CheW [Gemmatimonadetes bacterium]|nr:purine-binding chemotaxis protein CheW [Gemmatimonadota bacterium]
MTAPAPATQIVIFKLGDDHFAADVFAVERVLRHVAPTAIPNVPPWMVGVIDYQQRVVPVIDLRRRFGLAAADVRPETRLLVLNANGEWVGAVVDAVVEVVSVDVAAITPPPPMFRGLAGEYIRGLVRRADRLVICLDVARLLSTTDRLTLDQARTEVAANA